VSRYRKTSAGTHTESDRFEAQRHVILNGVRLRDAKPRIRRTPIAVAEVLVWFRERNKLPRLTQR
jgi:hypothetical protein